MSSSTRSSAAWLVALAAGSLSPAVWAETFEVGPGDDVEAAIAALSPGDELVVGGGMYLLDGRFTVDLTGTAEAPIIIVAKDGESPHFHRPDAGQNIWDLDNVHHVEIRGLVFSGGSAGLRLGAATHLTIDGCEIFDTDDVALRANDGGTYDGLVIANNHIHDTDNTGEGMYLGCNNDGCRVANSIIERNHVHHTNQTTVDQGDGIELKEGSYGNIIRDNVIHDTNYPCILTYSTAGNGPPNIIERNVMWNCGDHAIQSAADATIRNNIVLSSGADGIAMQPHQSGTPSNLTVVHNTVLHAQNDALSVSGISGTVLIANNALYAQAGNALSIGSGGTVTLAGNVVQGGVAGANNGYVMGDLTSDFLSAHYQGTPPIDVFPAPGSALLGAGVAMYAPADDFNATPRGDDIDAGAYAYAADGNPGWPIDAGFKDVVSPSTTSAGSGGAGGVGSASGGDAVGGSVGGAGGRPTGGGDGATGGPAATASGCSVDMPRRVLGDTSLRWLLLLALALATRRRC